MSRIRTIKPEFWTSEQVMECSPLARLCFIGMWNFCDDQGVHPASAKTLKAEVFPADDISAATVDALVGELIKNGLVVVYEAQKKHWWHVAGWHHQLIKNPSAPKYPPPECGSHIKKKPTTTPVVPQHYPSPTGGEDPVREGKGREVLEEGIKVKNKADCDGIGNDSPAEKPAASAAVRFDAAKFLVDHGAEQQTAADYLTLRKAKKAASTLTALRPIAAEAGKSGMSLQAVLEMCCSRGWVGFRAEWARDGPRQTIHDHRKTTIDELTGRNRHADQNSQPRDITAEVIRIA